MKYMQPNAKPSFRRVHFLSTFHSSTYSYWSSTIFKSNWILKKIQVITYRLTNINYIVSGCHHRSLGVVMGLHLLIPPIAANSPVVQASHNSGEDEDDVMDQLAGDYN